MNRQVFLVPVPRIMKRTGGVCDLKEGIEFSGITPAHELRLMPVLDRRGIRRTIAGNKKRSIPLMVRTGIKSLPSQGYRLSISHGSITVEGADGAGAYYGVCTLTQLIKLSGKKLPCLVIEDYPDFPARGVMLDISRSKVPTMETLFALVDKLASWKINQFQLYTEHTFAYKNHEVVWRGKSPMTAEEIRKLDGYCRERFIELVPNQNSFGHFGRWLEKPAYKHLAEDPETLSTLCPTDPESLALLAQLYDELLPNFTSNLFNVGCDETFLGGRSKDAVREKGEGRVYLEFLLKIYNLARKHGKTMMFWGDIIQKHPELIPELPGDIIVLEWGYESDHLYNDRCARIAKTGIPFYVCPGTSSWNTIAGRTDNCTANLINAAWNGLRYGATGFLNTDWGDSGHWQYLPVSYLGFMFGAAVSWCLRTNMDMPLEKSLSLFAFDDPTGNAGALACELGRVASAPGIHTANASPIFCSIREPLFDPGPAGWYPGITLWMRKDGIKRAMRQIDRAMEYLRKTRMQRQDANLIKDEFTNAAALLRHACNRGLKMLEKYGTGATGYPEQELNSLIKDAEKIIKEHKRIWLARNRPGGLEEGVELLERFTVQMYRAALAGKPGRHLP